MPPASEVSAKLENYMECKSIEASIEGTQASSMSIVDITESTSMTNGSTALGLQIDDKFVTQKW